MIHSVRNVSLFVFVSIILFHLINNLLWFYNDGYAVHGCHSVWHEKLSFDLSHFLKDTQEPLYKRILKLFEFFQLSRYGNTFSITNYSLTNLFLIFPYASSLNGHANLLLIYLINFFHFICVLGILVWVGSILFNRNVGIWSAVILSFYPGMIGLSRKVNVSLTTTLCILLLVIVLVQWKKFGKSAWGELLALVFCFGILSSPIFFAFAIPLVLFHIIYSLWVDNKKIFRLFAVCRFILLCGIFFHLYSGGQYIDFFENIHEQFLEMYQKFTFQSSSFIGSANDGIIESFLFAPQDSVCPCTQTTNVGCNLKTFLFYIMQCIKYSSPLFFIIGLCSLLILLISKTLNRYTKGILMLWVIGGYIILSIFHIKWGKFCTPMLPVFALSSAYVITKNRNWSKISKVFIIIVGVGVTLYYSYVPYPRPHLLEKLTEGLVSHRPLRSMFVPVAEETGRTIMDTILDSTQDLRIAFVDKDSPRFKGEWVTDMSLRVGLLVSTFITKPHTMEYFWSLDEYTITSFDEFRYFVVLTHEKVTDMQQYLFPHNERNEKYRLLILSENILYKSTFLYLVKIQVLSEQK